MRDSLLSFILYRGYTLTVHKTLHKITQAFAESIPYSKIEFPRSFLDRGKYLFWRMITPFFPYIRNALTTSNIIPHVGRQPFLLGHITKGVRLEDFIHELIKIGYGNHFVAWRDSGELIGLRITDGFKYQYHLRVFANGAVHGHYEYTPEAHPFGHLMGIGFEKRSGVFLKQLGALIVPATENEEVVSTALYYDCRKLPIVIEKVVRIVRMKWFWGSRARRV